MVFYLVFLVISSLIFLIGYNLPIEVVFLIAGSYYYMDISIMNRYVHNKWLLPPLLFSFLMLIYIYLGTLLIHYGGLIYERFNFALFDKHNLNKANGLTIFASSSMWIGYLLFNDFVRMEKRTLYIRLKSKFDSFKITLIFLFIIPILYYGALNRIVGYTSEGGTISSVISLFKVLSFFIMTIYFLFNYEKITKSPFDIKLIIMLFSLVLLGFVAAIKNDVVAPFIYILLIDYYKRRKINLKISIFAFTLFLLSFIVVPIMRQNIVNNQNLLYDIELRDVDHRNSITSFLFRITYVPQLILAIEYDGEKPDAVNKLWEYQLLSPIYSVLPRFVYETKPEITFGRWFSYYVYGSTYDNNIGATYQGILFMNGGLISVFFGFLIVGFMQGFIKQLFFNDKYLPIYLTLLLTLFMLPQEPWLFFVRILQSSISLYIFHRILINKNEYFNYWNGRIW